MTSSNRNIFHITGLLRWIHRSPVNSPHKGQLCGALIFPLIWAWTNRWTNNGEAGDLRRHHAHYDVIVIFFHMMHTTICVTRSYMQEICLKHYFQWTMSCTSWKFKSNIPWRQRTCDDTLRCIYATNNMSMFICLWAHTISLTQDFRRSRIG